MSDEKPLKVRCAEALGWEMAYPSSSVPGSWIGVNGRLPFPENCSTDAIPPFGEDTPQGWTCTGPLQARFGLSVIKSSYDGLYYASRHSVLPYANAKGSECPCMAIAEWVALNVRDGKATA